MSISQVVRAHGPDVGKVVSAWTIWFWSVNWNALGAFLSCVLTLLFILDKLGLLVGLRASGARLAKRLWPARARP